MKKYPVHYMVLINGNHDTGDRSEWSESRIYFQDKTESYLWCNKHPQTQGL